MSAPISHGNSCFQCFYSLKESIYALFSSLCQKITAIWEGIAAFFSNRNSQKNEQRIYVFETLEATTGQREELQKELDLLIKQSKSHPGCFTYDLFQNKENSNEFAVFMCFRDEQAYQEHIGASFIHDFERRLAKTHYQNVQEKLYVKI